MSEPQIEPELLASFLDGTASPAQREAVLQTLASSRTAYAEFMEASAILQDLSSEDGQAATGGTPTVPPIDIATRRKRIARIAPVAILAAASLVIVVTMQSRRRETTLIRVAQQTAMTGDSGSGSLRRALGDGWEDAGWTVTRGDVAVRDAAARAFRGGVRLAQLEVAAGANDSVAVSNARRHLRSLLESVPGSAPISALLASPGGADVSGSATDRELLTGQLRTMFGQPEWFDLGMWAGAADIAARRGQETFFAADGDAIAALAKLLTRKVEPPEQWALISGPAQLLVTGRWRASGGPQARSEAIRQLLAAAGG